MPDSREAVTTWLSTIFGGHILSALHESVSRLKLIEVPRTFGKKKISGIELLQHMCEQALQVGLIACEFIFHANSIFLHRSMRPICVAKYT